MPLFKFEDGDILEWDATYGKQRVQILTVLKDCYKVHRRGRNDDLNVKYIRRKTLDRKFNYPYNLKIMRWDSDKQTTEIFPKPITY